MNRRICGLVAAVLVSLSLGAHCQEYFVAPDGNDANPGTKDKPMKNPVKAVGKLQPGDTLFFRAGTYKCRQSRHVGLGPVRSGTADKPITFKNYENEHVVLNVSGAHHGFATQGHSYIVIDGFEIVGGKYHCMKLAKRAGHHVTVRNCEMHSGSGPLLFAWKTSNLLIENCHLHNSKRSHGMYLNVGCHDSIVRNVTSENNHGNSGIQFNASGGGIKNVLLERCLIRNNAHGFSLMGIQNCTFRNNVITSDGVDGPRGSGWREIITWTYGKPGTPCENSLFENNTLVNLIKGGRKLSHLVHVKSKTKGLTFRNNIFLVRGKPVFTIAGDSREGHVFENNCLWVIGGGKKREVSKVGTLADFAKANKLKAEGNFHKDPLFEDLEKADFRLKEGSPCIDAGLKTENPSKVEGKARDLGALERGAELRIGCLLPWKKKGAEGEKSGK